MSGDGTVIRLIGWHGNGISEGISGSNVIGQTPPLNKRS